MWQTRAQSPPAGTYWIKVSQVPTSLSWPSPNPGPHLPQTPLHVASKEPQDSQLGTQWARDIPQGEGPESPLVRLVGDMARDQELE